MERVIQPFDSRQYMRTEDYEFFHYKDESALEVEYHNHDFYELYFLISGNVSYLIEGKSHKLSGGDMILIGNRLLHKPVIELGSAYERIVIWVNPKFIAKLSAVTTNLALCFEASPHSGYSVIRPEGDNAIAIKSALRRLEKCFSDSSYGNEVLRTAFISELLVYINKTILTKGRFHGDIDIDHNEKISNIVAFINSNLATELSLKLLSAKFFISKFHLLREFKKYTDFTVHRYIYQKRLLYAKTLLEEGNSIAETADKCGFSDYSNFIRAFRSSYGTTPKKYGDRLK